MTTEAQRNAAAMQALMLDLPQGLIDALQSIVRETMNYPPLPPMDDRSYLPKSLIEAAQNALALYGARIVPMDELATTSVQACLDTNGPMPDEATLAETDAIYDEAVAIVKRHNNPSISFVQRHLKIGYNRTARLLERMQCQGLVSPMNRIGVRVVIGGASPIAAT